MSTSNPKIQIPEAFIDLLTLSKWRNKVYYGGRGGAKSHNFARSLLILGAQQPLRIACAREIQKSIKDSVYQLLCDVIRSHELESFYTIMSDRIKGENGTTFLFLGLKHNITGVKSLEGVDIVWVEEAENVSDNSWEVLIPTIRKENSEIWVSFNSKYRSDPTYVRFVQNAGDDTLVKKVTYADNPFFPEVLDKERLKLKAVDTDAYNHIWEGDFDERKEGSVYGKQIQAAREDGRITNVPYDPAYEVWTAWDLGFGDATAIWWLQYVGRELRWIDYYESTGELLDHYVQIVKSKPYNYRIKPVALPHDGNAGNIRGGSVSDQLKSMGLDNIVLERESDITPGINLVRQALSYSVFDRENCRDGLHALENYTYEWNEDKQRFSNRPLHDWSSDAADAARYAVRSISKMTNKVVKTVDFSINKSSGSYMGV